MFLRFLSSSLPLFDLATSDGKVAWLRLLALEPLLIFLVLGFRGFWFWNFQKCYLLWCFVVRPCHFKGEGALVKALKATSYAMIASNHVKTIKTHLGYVKLFDLWCCKSFGEWIVNFVVMGCRRKSLRPRHPSSCWRRLEISLDPFRSLFKSFDPWLTRDWPIRILACVIISTLLPLRELTSSQLGFWS